MVYFINKNKKIEHLVDKSVYGKVDKNGIVFLRNIGFYTVKTAWGVSNDDVADLLFYQALDRMKDIKDTVIQKISKNADKKGIPIKSIGRTFILFALSGQNKKTPQELAGYLIKTYDL